MVSDQANERQVGGNHYKSDFQHWDFVNQTALPYIPAQVARYLCRWKKKGKEEDLRKAVHFMEKLIEEEATRRKIHRILVENFILSNKIEMEEANALRYLVKYYVGAEDLLVMARGCIVRTLSAELMRKEALKSEAQAEIEDLFSTMPNLNPKGDM